VSHLERFMSFKPLLGMAFRLSSPPVLAERFTRVMCPPGPRMLGWVAKTLARRQHDEYLKSIHRVWHYIPEAPEYVSFCTLKFLTRLADVNFDRVIEHLSTSDIVIVDGTRISRNPAWRLTLSRMVPYSRTECSALSSSGATGAISRPSATRGTRSAAHP
jgi:hypothetical protein